MEDWQKRVVEEAKELDAKQEKLDAFQASDMWDTLSNEDQGLLLAQSAAMMTYRSILHLRIAKFHYT